MCILEERVTSTITFISNLILYIIMKYTVLILLTLVMCRSVWAQNVEFEFIDNVYEISYDSYDDSGNKYRVETTFTPSNLVDPIYSASVSAESDGYVYSYEVTSGISSRQELTMFHIERVERANLLSAPEYWEKSDLFKRPYSGWKRDLSIGDAAGINPGESVGPFIAVSPRLPGISNSTAFGYGALAPRFPDEPPEEVVVLLESVRKFPKNSATRRVLGPGLLPGGSLEIHLDSLIAHTDEALTLGWIDDSGLATRIGTLLEDARAHLLAADSVASAASLTDLRLVAHVERDRGLTTEAYSLLSVNADFLLGRLPRSTPASPACEGRAATISVDTAFVVRGGPLDGQPYRGALEGTSGDDVIVGTAADDYVAAGSGDDVVCGLAGDDELVGDNGEDRLFGGEGADSLRGSNGVDYLSGGGGGDTLDGGNGSDDLVGDEGDDLLLGGHGSDVLVGGAGQDEARGGKGRDTCSAELEAECEVDGDRPDVE